MIWLFSFPPGFGGESFIHNVSMHCKDFYPQELVDWDNKRFSIYPNFTNGQFERFIPDKIDTSAFPKDDRIFLQKSHMLDARLPELFPDVVHLHSDLDEDSIKYSIMHHIIKNLLNPCRHNYDPNVTWRPYYNDNLQPIDIPNSIPISREDMYDGETIANKLNIDLDIKGFNIRANAIREHNRKLLRQFYDSCDRQLLISRGFPFYPEGSFNA